MGTQEGRLAKGEEVPQVKHGGLKETEKYTL